MIDINKDIKDIVSKYFIDKYLSNAKANLVLQKTVINILANSLILEIEDYYNKNDENDKNEKSNYINNICRLEDAIDRVILDL